MIQDGKLFCDRCQQRIPLGVKDSTQVLVELKKGSLDRHFCEACMAEMQRQSAAQRPDGTAPR
jgi:hypothetical protein